MGDDYISAYRYADKKIDNQTDDQSIATDGRQSLTAGKLSDNSNIYWIERLLQDTAGGRFRREAYLYGQYYSFFLVP